MLSGFSLSTNARLLLAAAMNRSQAMYHRGRVNADNTARRKTALYHIEGALIVHMSKDGNNHGLVADVKVRVTRGQPCVAVANKAGHRQLHDIETETHETLVIVLQDLVVLI